MTPPERLKPSPRIVFLVMSAVHNAAAVDQLARALSPHTVLVHHDFSQTANFMVREPNVRFVPNPKQTGWARFSFVEGIFHSLVYALGHLEFDYLQLLSPTCLPIKPIEEFESHISGDEEAHFGCVDLLDDEDAFMSVGYRAFMPGQTFRHRAARWLVSRKYYSKTSPKRDAAGVSFRTGFNADRNGNMTLAARVTRMIIAAASQSWIGRHPFGAKFRPCVGSVWFGAKRHVIEKLVHAYEKPGIYKFFSRVVIAEEFLIPTLLNDLGVQPGPLNHYINVFNEAHPQWIDAPDFRVLQDSPAFFARKFPDDPASAIRESVLKLLVCSEAAFEAGLPRAASPTTNVFELPSRAESGETDAGRNFGGARPGMSLDAQPRAARLSL